jgi:hypothetical protein
MSRYALKRKLGGSQNLVGKKSVARTGMRTQDRPAYIDYATTASDVKTNDIETFISSEYDVLKALNCQY